jgi:DNA repair and recombination protein RAD54B
VQNNLDEFYALLDFATPELLGAVAAFRRVFGEPITASRDGGASAEARALGAARSAQLQEKVAGFVLRRTQAVLAGHLPPLSVFAVFCRPSGVQAALLGLINRSKHVTRLVAGGGGGDGVLPIIGAARKACNHPDLLLPSAAAAEAAEEGGGGGGKPATATAAFAELAAREGFAPGVLAHSGKLQALDGLLGAVLAAGDRAVVVCTSTAALDLIHRLVCAPRGAAVVRIDGGTKVDDRQMIVDGFNSRGVGQARARPRVAAPPLPCRSRSLPGERRPPPLLKR